jgi:hypothetical protein
MTQLFDIGAAADYLKSIGAGSATIYFVRTLVSSGQIPHLRIGKKFYVSRGRAGPLDRKSREAVKAMSRMTSGISCAFCSRRPPKPELSWQERPRVTGLPLFDLAVRS